MSERPSRQECLRRASRVVLEAAIRIAQEDAAIAAEEQRARNAAATAAGSDRNTRTGEPITMSMSAATDTINLEVRFEPVYDGDELASYDEATINSTASHARHFVVREHADGALQFAFAAPESRPQGEHLSLDEARRYVSELQAILAAAELASGICGPETSPPAARPGWAVEHRDSAGRYAFYHGARRGPGEPDAPTARASRVINPEGSAEDYIRVDGLDRELAPEHVLDFVAALIAAAGELAAAEAS